MTEARGAPPPRRQAASRGARLRRFARITIAACWRSIHAVACRTRLRIAAIAIAWLASSSPALAQRPALAGEKTFGVAGGDILVHYATTGVDAVRATDGDANGVPDFVDEVAATAESALDHYLSLGFRRPLDDGTLGGDGRIDIYLRNLNASDGNAGNDSCTGNHCVGFIAAENDYAGYAYPSVTEGIRSVIPHELFHLVQTAYSNMQPSTWTEGTAVWAVENLYGDGNSDFERFLPTFLPRSFRPFERPVGGFGDGYPYGAALWPYFLEHRHDVDLVVASWEGCENAGFLDATTGVLAKTGGTVDEAWIEFTRWNLFTGSSAPRGTYPAAGTWPQVPREPAISDHGTIYVEGVSARYVPITSVTPFQITVATPTIHIAAWLVADDAKLTDGIDLTSDGPSLSASADAGSYTLVVTGLTRNSITTAVDVTLGPPDSGGGGCSSTPPPHTAFLFVVAWLLLRRRPYLRGDSGTRPYHPASGRASAHSAESFLIQASTSSLPSPSLRLPVGDGYRNDVA